MSQGASGGHRWRTSVGTTATRGSTTKAQRVLWTTVAVVFGGLAIWLICLLWFNKSPKSQIVSIGMTYDNPVFRPTPFLLGSAGGVDHPGAFDELHQQDKSERSFVKSEYPSGTKLDGQNLLGIVSSLSPKSRKETLLVYLNLQGGVVEQPDGKAAACFVTLRAHPDSVQTNGDGHQVLVRDLLANFGEARFENVLVLLEAGDCGPNWRAGILNRDFIAQLKVEAAEAVQKFSPKLRIIGAVSEGETAQASRHIGEEQSQSVFSYFAVQGLLGEADGWTYDRKKLTSTQEKSRQPKVRKVNSDELFAYLHGQVGDWSRSHRAAQQTVWRYPDEGPVWELSQIDLGRSLAAKAKQKLDDTAAKADGKEKPSDGKSTSDPKDKEGKKSADATDDGKASANDKSKDAKPNEKPTTGKESSSDTTAASTADNQAKPDQNKKGKNDVANKEIKDAENLRSQLLTLWLRRDAMRARDDGFAVQLAPREWRRLQLELIHAEQCLGAGEPLGRVGEELQKAERTLGKIDVEVGRFETLRRQSAEELLSLAVVESVQPPPLVAKGKAPLAANPAAVPSQNPNEPTTEEQKQFADLLKLAFPNESDRVSAAATSKPIPTPPDNKTAPPASEPPKHEDLKKLLLKYPQLRGRVWLEAVRPIRKLTQPVKANTSADDFIKASAPIELALDITKESDGKTLIPAEALAVLEVIAASQASKKDDIRWSPGMSLACGRVLELRWRFEQFAAENIAFSKLLRDEFQKAEDKLIAAERWILFGQAELALENLDQAEAMLERTKSTASTLRRAARLKANIAAELPDLARWVARRQEALGDKSINSSRQLLRRFAEKRKSSENDSTGELKELREFVKSQNPTWFDLFDVIEQSTALFQSTEDGALRLTEITTLTNQLEQTWNEWRNLDNEVSQLSASKTPTAENWNRIQDVLLVPWISGEKRRQLLDQLDLLDRVEPYNGSDRPRTTIVRGDWQAFWAIETLRLAGLDATMENDLWVLFASSLKTSTDAEDLAESIASSARLGHGIANAFRSIAKDADNASDDQSAKENNIDPKRGEQLTRGVDPGDIPKTQGAQADFWFARRLAREHHEFAHARAIQAHRVSQLGGNPLATQSVLLEVRWASMADRWKKLSSFDGSNTSAVESPFLMEIIPDDHLYWGSGDPSEIRFDLKLNPRPGAKFTKTLVRVLDANTLKVEPKQLAQPDGYELTEPEQQEVAATIRKPAGVTLAESVLTIALLDKDSQFPWDLRRVTLRTPQKDQDWRIEFRAKGELADRDNPVAKERNRPDRKKLAEESDTNRIVLRLPTTPDVEKPLSLLPVLIPPPDSKVKSVTVKVFELDENGEPRKTPSGQSPIIEMSRDGRPIPLKLAAAPVPAAPASATANPKPATSAPAPAPAGHDVSRGWLFEIHTDLETVPIRQYVVPRVRPPETYFKLSPIPVTFRDRTLIFELQRRSDNEEPDPPLRPELVRVELELPRALDELRTDNDLVRTFKRGESNRIAAQFGEQHLAKLNATPFVISLNVAGWPRAFAYQIRHDAPAVEFHPKQPVIVAPAPGAVFKVKEKLPVEIQIDSQHLNSFGLDERWKLQCELIPERVSAINTRTQSRDLFRSLYESVELISQGEAEWLLTAKVRNHQVEFDTEGLKGRFFLRATATHPDGNRVAIGGGVSDKVQIAIADPKHKPPTPTGPNAPIRIPYATELPVSVKISAEDEEAGISEVAAGFDLDMNGELGDAEIIKESKQTWINPLDEPKRQMTLTIPAVRFKAKPTGKHDLLVIAKNGVQNACEKPLVIPIEIDQARGWVQVKIPNLGMKGCLLFIDGIKQPGAARDGVVLPLVEGKHKFEVASDIIETKRGPAQEVTLTKEDTKDNPVPVVLEPPK